MTVWCAGDSISSKERAFSCALWWRIRATSTWNTVGGVRSVSAWGMRGGLPIVVEKRGETEEMACDEVHDVVHALCCAPNVFDHMWWRKGPKRRR